MRNKLSKVAIMLSVLFTTQAFAVQTVEVGNMLYNQDASAAGVTQSSSTIKFYTGSAVLCDTKVVPFGTAVTVIPGTTTGVGATTCTSSQAITSITGTPITFNATVGAVYGTTPISYTVTGSDVVVQLMFQQRASTTSGTVTTTYGPIFDTTNGTVSTAGTPVFLSQAHFKMPTQH
jgi:hypothetical protein